MADDTYTATLMNDGNTETVQLESIGGLPQKSIIRQTIVEGTPTDVIWNLDPDESEPTYRPADSEGYGEGGVE